MIAGPTYYRIAQLASKRNAPGVVPFCKATIWSKVKEGMFPPPIKVSANVTCWRADDIAKWLANPAAPWVQPNDGAQDEDETSETKKPL